MSETTFTFRVEDTLKDQFTTAAEVEAAFATKRGVTRRRLPSAAG